MAFSTGGRRTCPDDEALDRIGQALDGREWDADTLDAVAAAVRSTGRAVGDVDDDMGGDAPPSV